MALWSIIIVISKQSENGIINNIIRPGIQRRRVVVVQKDLIYFCRYRIGISILIDLPHSCTLVYPVPIHIIINVVTKPYSFIRHPHIYVLYFGISVFQ